jgi:hypothetical protein
MVKVFFILTSVCFAQHLFAQNTTSIVNNTNQILVDSVVTNPLPSASTLYNNGFKDAKTQYDGYSSASSGTLIATVLTGVGGLVPAFICSLTPPADKNLGMQDSTLAQLADYKNGFKEGARLKKSKKIWTNFGIGALVDVVAYFAIFKR